MAGSITGAVLLLGAGPILGEMIATTSPLTLKFPAHYRYLKYIDVAFPTQDGLTLRGWFFPAGRRDAPAVIYAPATGKDQRQGLSLVAPLVKAGYQVLLFSYRGSGKSDGDRLQFSYGARESADIDAAVSYLTEGRRIPRVALIGHSAGAVSAILSASRNPRIGAVVAAAPYTTLEDIWEDNRPSLFPGPLFRVFQNLFQLRKGFSQAQVRPIDEIARIAPRPVLLIEGTADRRVQPDQSQRLYSAAAEPKQIIWLQGASHAQVRSPGLDQLLPHIISFLDDSLQGGRQRAQNLRLIQAW